MGVVILGIYLVKIHFSQLPGSVANIHKVQNRTYLRAQLFCVEKIVVMKSQGGS